MLLGNCGARSCTHLSNQVPLFAAWPLLPTAGCTALSSPPLPLSPLPIPPRPVPAGLSSTLLLPQEVRDAAPPHLAQFTRVVDTLDITALDIPDPGLNTPTYNESHLMLQSDTSVTPVRDGAPPPRLLADALMVGDPLHPTDFTLDLSQVQTDTAGERRFGHAHRAKGDTA